jgi:hypothetical protein
MNTTFKNCAGVQNLIGGVGADLRHWTQSSETLELRDCKRMPCSDGHFCSKWLVKITSQFIKAIFLLRQQRSLHIQVSNPHKKFSKSSSPLNNGASGVSAFRPRLLVNVSISIQFRLPSQPTTHNAYRTRWKWVNCIPRGRDHGGR